MRTLQVTCFVLAVILKLLSSPVAAEVNPVFSEEQVHKHRNCHIYLAPSKIGGWGVFAARDFEHGEIVEMWK
jgi:hypothetical protein